MLTRAAPALVLLMLLVGCSQSLMMQGRRHLNEGRYQAAIDVLYEEISANPQNAAAWRELGYACYQQGNLTKAEDALMQAVNIRQEAPTHLYLGLVFEKREDYERAINAYTTALSLQSKGRTASLTRAHLDRLLAKRLEVEVSRVLEDEENISTDTIPDNTVAVANFDASLLTPDLAPIALGLAELTAADLSKVHALTVVERQKLDLIMQELNLSATGYVDPATAPRMGRLMGAGKLVTGAMVGIGEEGLKLNGVIVGTADSSTFQPEGIEGSLERFFRMEKDFVFAVLDELGIALSAEERDAISEVPTESYLAFLAFCRGLDFQRRGMYDAAKREFNQSLRHDRNFQQAREHLNTSASLASAGTYEQSFTNYDQSLRDETLRQGAGAGVDSRLSALAQNSGTIPRAGGSPALQPPVTETTVRVVIQGDLDAR
ncbi:MAG: tetratricopeptide repeat protein [Candidatus Zixiibacteriota bacterium]